MKLVKIFFRFFILLFLISYISYHLAYENKIYPGISVAGLPLGNQAKSQAMKNLENFTLQKPLSFTLTDEKQKWTVDLDKADFRYLTEQVINDAHSIGRTGNCFVALKNRVLAWIKPQDLPIKYNIDHEKLKEQIRPISSQTNIPAIEPSVDVVGQQIQVEPGKNGRELNETALVKLLTDKILFLDYETIPLPISDIAPSITADEIKETKNRAENLLGKKAYLNYADKKWEINDQAAISMLSFTGGYKQEKIVGFVSNIAKSINSQPENAAFQFSNGKVTEFRPGKDGQALGEKATIDIIVDLLNEIESNEKEASGNLPVTITPPAITTKDANSFGIQESIGRGISYFKGSIPSRIHNIQLASSKISSALIAPNEVLSFNKALGDVSKETGYQEAYIIKKGRTILGDGGGVCQVSTTLFRAALNAGLPIFERHPHAYRVAYYEQFSPPGLDATVFDPNADLKIKNNTTAHVLIQITTDIKNKILTVDLYGAKDGRTVKISKPKIWDQISPPPDLIQDDPTLPAGTIKQIDWSAWGSKISFDYFVERNGEVLEKRTFYSNYQPWRAVYLRGSK